jgi:hypothetical protein
MQAQYPGMRRRGTAESEAIALNWARHACDALFPNLLTDCQEI